MESSGLVLPGPIRLPAGAKVPFASPKRELGDLDRVAAWPMVSGMVNVAPGFTQTTNVINGCSDLLLDLNGPEAGRHARTATGMAQLPLNLPVVIAAEVGVRV
jgi:hypothetical protein